MRTKNSLLNMISAFGGQILAIVIGFIARIVFVNCLSQEYLGLSSVFSSVLTLLSLAELGIGPAMTFAMYKPISESNIELIKGLMQLYRKVYICVGCFILVLGLGFLPLYRFFITTETEFPYLDLIYFLYVINTSISYFYSYKRTILEANQKKYKYNILHYAVYVMLNIIQGIALILTHNYIIYLTVQIGFTWIENYLVSKMADHSYPYLKEKNVFPLSKEVTDPIWKNVKAMVFHKIGRMVVQSTDSLLLSKFFGLMISGIYANYILISNAVSSVISQIFYSVTAGVGNLSASGDKEKMYVVFQKLFFMNAWLYGFATICFICLYQTFIELFFGTVYLFDNMTLVMFSLSFYTSGMRQTVNTYKDANGLYYKDWYKPILESLVNLGTSIMLLKIFGPTGVFAGTIVSNLFISTWIEAIVLYDSAMDRPVLPYFALYIKYSVISALIGGIIYFLCSAMPQWGMMALIFKAITCLIGINLLYAAYYRKSKLFISYIHLFMMFIEKLKNKMSSKMT